MKIINLLTVIFLLSTQISFSFALVVYSEDFKTMHPLLDMFTPQGEDINPSLTIKNPPANTKSFSLVMSDPDAPNEAHIFYHWIVVNIDKNTREIPRDSIPGDQLMNGNGTKNYGGPAPADGETHRYIFTICALSDVIQVDDSKTIEENLKQIADLTIACDSAKAIYSKDPANYKKKHLK